MREGLVLGIGNTLLADEGVGVHVIRHLESSWVATDAVRWMDGGTLSFTLTAPIARATHLIVVDAASLGAPPGTVRTFRNEQMDRFLGTHGRSVHEVGLLDLLDIARLEGTVPASRTLIGIQPRSCTLGAHCTPGVDRVIPAAAEAVVTELRDWGFDVVASQRGPGRPATGRETPPSIAP